jgi:long-chain acyl-CoA synthetase
MTGYRKNKAATDEVFYTHNGQKFFRTGDMGKMVEGKFLKITGRIKEQFKLENGKYVVPAPLEDIYARSPFIAQIYISGNNLPCPVALVVPNYANLLPWCEKKGLAAKAPTAAQLADPNLKHFELFDEPAFKDLISQEVSVYDAVNYVSVTQPADQAVVTRNS